MSRGPGTVKSAAAQKMVRDYNTKTKNVEGPPPYFRESENRGPRFPNQTAQLFSRAVTIKKLFA